MHQIDEDKVITSKLDECRIGRNCQTRFWCGFCRKLIDLKKRGLDAWTERFDHIDDHFMGRKGLEVQRIRDWVNVDGKKPRGESPYTQEDSSAHEMLQRVDPMARGSASGSQEEGVSEQASIPKATPADELLPKRGRSTDSEGQRPAKRKRDQAVSSDVFVFCCSCRDGSSSTKLHDSCIQCNHKFCDDCKREVIDVEG